MKVEIISEDDDEDILDEDYEEEVGYDRNKSLRDATDDELLDEWGRRPIEGCFIATVAYGTPMAEELDILRYWRDNSLKTNWIGRQFVNLYYATSPPIANFIKKRNYLRRFVRKCLNPFIKYLKVKQNVN